MKTRFTLPALLLLSALLISCGSEATAPDTTDTTNDTAASEAVTEAPRDTLPADLDFGGETVNLLIRNDMPLAEFDITEETGDIVSDAIYQRNRAVAERLNITFNHIGEACAWANIPTFTGLVEKSVMAGDGAYDIIGTYSMAMADLAVINCLYDLAQTPHLDFEQPWWSDILLEKSYVGDRLYFITGDISANMTYYTYAYFFNKSMIETYDLESPYTLVDDGRWTIDKFFELSTGIYKDLNGNGKKDLGDQFGSYTNSVYVDSLYWGSGLTMIESNPDGTIRLSDDLHSEKLIKLLEKSLDAFTVSDDHYFTGDFNTTFADGNILFCVDEMHYAITHLRDADFEYGILPAPKFDDAQQSYYTTMGGPIFMYGMPLTIAKPDMASAVLEALASESYYNLSPVLFEKAMKVKYSTDTDSARMFDIIRQSRTTDHARTFGRNLADIYAVFRTQLTDKNKNWASNYEKKLKKYQKSIDALSAIFTEE